METEKEREMVQRIQHDFHEHPLALVEEQSNQSEKIYCSGCGEVVLGPCFSCTDCKYHLHKKCAEAPYEINYHPLHRRHFGFFLRKSPPNFKGYACAFCNKKRNMFFYECNICWFALDIKCANLLSHKIGENFLESKDDAFQRLLIFLENHKGEFKELYCTLCHESLVDSFYVSVECKIYLHKKCFELFIKRDQIDHPCHRRHSLILQFSYKKCFCKLCQKEDDHNFFYHCFACKFDIHPECAFSRPIIKDERYHEHPFTLFWKQDSFICNACGIEGNGLSYICSTCHLQLHKHCTSLPHIIKVTRHNHFLSHKYFLKKSELEEQECQICFDEVKTEHGSYQCLKEDCNYIVHVNCATADGDLYYEIDLANQVEEQDENLMNSITCVIKRNEHGEATIIKHFYHEHNLLLEDNVKEGNDRHCDGCMLSISTPFYHCLECNFFLHKNCAELPKIKRHWFHRFLATLIYEDCMDCSLCNRYCSGLFYKSRSDNESFYFCLRCAIVPNIINCEGHKHSLFFDYKCKEQCNACGIRSRYGAFRCKKCTFALDFGCTTLPHAIKHKCDTHLLELAYGDENDDGAEHYCDICEEKRDPSHWYYYCSTCDNSAHTECVLGKYPFIKDGITWPRLNHWHDHDLIFVQKVDGYPKCIQCGKLCQDQSLKCSECNNFRHNECRWLLL